MLGPSHFCDSGLPADPPGYPILFLGLSKINSLLGGGVPATRLLKMPPIVPDLGIARIAGVFAVRLEGSGGRTARSERSLRQPSYSIPRSPFCSAVWGRRLIRKARALRERGLVTLRCSRKTVPN